MHREYSKIFIFSIVLHSVTMHSVAMCIPSASNVAQGSFSEECEKVDWLIKFLKSHTDESASLDQKFLNKLRLTYSNIQRFLMGLYSCVWGPSLHQTELDTLWVQDSQNFSKNIISYLAGKFMGARLLCYYKNLEQKQNKQDDNIFYLSEQDFRKLTNLKGTSDSPPGQYQNCVHAIITDEAMRTKIQKFIENSVIQQEARRFELVLALLHVYPWFHQYVDEQQEARKTQLEVAAKALPLRVLSALAQIWSLSPNTYAESVAAYALVVSKDPKWSKEIDQFTDYLIRMEQGKAFERLLPPQH